jgi:hypothetical protein
VFLAKHGVLPLDEALRISPARRLALVVLTGEFEGGTFDWRNLAWRERK